MKLRFSFSYIFQRRLSISAILLLCFVSWIVFALFAYYDWHTKSSPNDLLSSYNLGIKYEGQNKFDLAEEDLQTALAKGFEPARNPLKAIHTLQTSPNLAQATYN